MQKPEDRFSCVKASSRENLVLLHANNKGADQPGHPHSLIIAFDIHSLESIIAKLAAFKISRFYLVSVAEQSGLSFT